MYRILLLAYEDYRKYATPILRENGYTVQTRDPSKYSGLGRQHPNLVLQEGSRSDLNLTRKVVADINKSEKSISMLVVGVGSGPEDIRLVMRELVKLRGKKF